MYSLLVYFQSNMFSYPLAYLSTRYHTHPVYLQVVGMNENVVFPLKITKITRNLISNYCVNYKYQMYVLAHLNLLIFQIKI